MSDCPMKLAALPLGIHSGMPPVSAAFQVEHDFVGLSACPSCNATISNWTPSDKVIVLRAERDAMAKVVEAASWLSLTDMDPEDHKAHRKFHRLADSLAALAASATTREKRDE